MQFVLYGATGDLSVNKIFPALFSLWKKNQLGRITSIMLVSRRPWSDAEMKNYICEKNRNIGIDPQFTRFYDSLCMYVQADSGDEQQMRQLGMKLTPPCLFFFSVSPVLYDDILQKLQYQEFKDVLSHPETRLLIEKPFGYSGEGARALEARALQVADDTQLYRIDHYLAKDSVLKLGAWARKKEVTQFFAKRTIHEVCVSLFEQKDVAGRALFYDATGALTDVGQNHALMVAAAVGTTAVHGDVNVERTAFLESLSVHDTDSWIFGQYGGYEQELGLLEASATETFFSISAVSSLPLFESTHFRLRGGKAVHASRVSVKIFFSNVDQYIFISLQPQRFVEISPALKATLSDEEYAVLTSLSFSEEEPDAYETLIVEAARGNDDYFASYKEVLASWAYIDEVKRLRKGNAIPLMYYQKGWNPDGKDVV